MSYVYDDGDHTTQMTLPSDRVDYGRDGIAQNITSNAQYRGDNQMLSCDYGNGLRDTHSYDLQGRLLSQMLKSGTEATTPALDKSLQL